MFAVLILGLRLRGCVYLDLVVVCVVWVVGLERSAGLIGWLCRLLFELLGFCLVFVGW